jgi:hypothetical protein
MLNLFLVVPYQMMQIDSIIARHSAQLPKPRRPGNNVYFIRDSGGFYTGDLVQMDPMLREPDLLLFSRGPELDAELRRQNWPAAVLVERKNGIEEWSIGPRGVAEESTGSGRFVFAYSDRPPAEAPSP